jgi:hypothetical protein
MNDTYQHADGVPRKIEPLNTIPTPSWAADDIEDLEDALDEAQEAAYELAHDAVLAATNGDKLGAEALLHAVASRLGEILEVIRRRDTDIA